MSHPLPARLFAEFLGTFALVFIGAGVNATALAFGGGGLVAAALANGLTVLAVIEAVGDVSGAHLNPAVSLGFTVAGRLPVRTLFPYIAAQCLGALAAGGLIVVLTPEQAAAAVNVPHIGAWRAVLLEATLTWLLMFVILRVATGPKEKGIIAGTAIGGTVALCILMGGPASGASMNPARSLGPALATLSLDGLWVYLTAPFVGAALAVPTHRLLGTSPD